MMIAVQNRFKQDHVPSGGSATALAANMGGAMTNAALGMTMLCLIVVVIMMGFPTAFRQHRADDER